MAQPARTAATMITDPTSQCLRCAGELAPTPAFVQALPTWDTARIRAQGWVGSSTAGPVCLECLSPAEASFLVPEPRTVPRGSGRFVRDGRPASREPRRIGSAS